MTKQVRTCGIAFVLVVSLAGYSVTAGDAVQSGGDVLVLSLDTTGLDLVNDVKELSFSRNAAELPERGLRSDDVIVTGSEGGRKRDSTGQTVSVASLVRDMELAFAVADADSALPIQNLREQDECCSSATSVAGYARVDDEAGESVCTAPFGNASVVLEDPPQVNSCCVYCVHGGGCHHCPPPSKPMCWCDGGGYPFFSCDHDSQRDDRVSWEPAPEPSLVLEDPPRKSSCSIQCMHGQCSITCTAPLVAHCFCDGHYAHCHCEPPEQ